jgi:polyisoprenyl-teichoic acid--peptidoglycan teichoic acid transferase
MTRSFRKASSRFASSSLFVSAALLGIPVAAASQTIPVNSAAPTLPLTTAATTAPAATTPPTTTPSSSTPASTTAASTMSASTTTNSAKLAVSTAAKATIPGATTSTTKPQPPLPASKRNKQGQWSPNGRAPGPVIAFSPTPGSLDKSTPSATSEADAYKAIQPDGKVLFFLIIGSDARPKEKVDRSRSDAVHLFAYSPVLKSGSFVGFPRDSYVTTPKGVKRKLSGVMSTEGPEAVASTISKLMNVPVSRFMVTGFDGFTKMVEGIGGVAVEVNPAMNDRYSGAQFQQGWFQMNGEAALAFNRARKTLPKGDLSRSGNQEKFLLATLTKLRGTTSNVSDLTKWVNIARKNSVTNIRPADWLYYAQVARGIDPTRIRPTVVPGSAKTINKESVIAIDQTKLAVLSKDIQDGVLGN